MQSSSFKWLLLLTAIVLWLACWLCWRLWRAGKSGSDRLTAYLPRQRLLWLAPGTMVIAIAAVVMLAKHPLMPIYLNILGKVIRGH